MIGVDTNILVRYLTADDAEQLERVDGLLAEAESRGQRLHIDSIVLCELVWVLRSAYSLNRSGIADILDQLLGSRLFSVSDRDSTKAALAAYRQGRGDFSDYLIGVRNRRSGCRTTTTFDQKLADDPHFEPL